MDDDQRSGDERVAAQEPERAARPEAAMRPTPIFISPRTRNILILSLVVGLVLLVRAAPTILTISLGGALLALILSFPTRLLERLMPRAVAIVLTMLSLVATLVLVLLILVPILIEQLSGLIDSIPDLADAGDRLLVDVIVALQERGLVSPDTQAVIEDVRQGALERATQVAESLLANILGAASSVFDLGVKTFGIIFVAIYLVIDSRRVKAAYLRLTPSHYRRDAMVLWDEFGSSLSRYLGGLTISLLVQGALSGIALWILGVPYPLLLGAWVSLTAIIPYLGAFLGAIPAVLLGFYQSPTTGVLVIVLYIAIQQVESNLLTPRIQGQAVRVHPIIVLLSVIAASEIDGLRGAIFAVPILAVLRVLLDFLAARVRVRP
ncbi:MAG: AI-2E family transporter [Sphaerobacter thermophilus]|uniref:AI-2E family transporter n=1 Tax=Sphaerobacter thermophilus TaxID=2057 RepID=UPI00396D853A